MGGRCSSRTSCGTDERRGRAAGALLLLLLARFTGGDTQFADGPTVRPRRDAALLFLHPVLHQGAPVLAGRKYVLRSDVMYRR